MKCSIQNLNKEDQLFLFMGNVWSVDELADNLAIGKIIINSRNINKNKFTKIIFLSNSTKLKSIKSLKFSKMDSLSSQNGVWEKISNR